MRSKSATKKHIGGTITKTRNRNIGYCIGITGSPQKMAGKQEIRENFRELRTIWRSTSRDSISRKLAEETGRRKGDKKLQFTLAELEVSEEGFHYFFIAFR